MGLMDRFRSRRSREESDEDHGVAPPVDQAARREQLVELDDALRSLARKLAGNPDRMRNPGYAMRVEDYRTVAAEAARLERDGFDRADLTDLAAQVVPLSRGASPLPTEYKAVAAEHQRVLDATAALRDVLPSEQATADPGSGGDGTQPG